MAHKLGSHGVSKPSGTDFPSELLVITEGDHDEANDGSFLHW
jgi:hypothetical protein